MQKGTMRLSKAQTKVLNQMEFNKWYSAYELQCSIITLKALQRRGLVKMRLGMGAIFSPRVNITFQRLIEMRERDRRRIKNMLIGLEPQTIIDVLIKEGYRKEWTTKAVYQILDELQQDKGGK